MNVLTLSLTLILLTFQLHTVCGQDFLKKLAESFFGLNPSPNEEVKTVERSVSSGVCNIDIKTGLNKTASGSVKEPLFLKYSRNTYQLMIPDENGDLIFKSGESALVACTSDQKPNHLTFSEYL